jgi:hypothetical protein
MPFLTPLKVQLLSDKSEFPWITLEPFVYEAKDGTVYTVPKHFRTDFASVPKALMAIPIVGQALAMRFFGNGTWLGVKPAVLHDWARRKRPDGTRPMPAASAHKLFKEALEEEGYPYDLVENYYAAVVKMNSKD